MDAAGGRALRDVFQVRSHARGRSVTTEKTIETATRVALSAEGVMVKKNRIEACWRCGAKPKKTDGMGLGSSDLICCVPPSGRFMALEMKGPKGKATDEQLLFIDQVRKHGGLAAVCHSVEDALAVLLKERSFP